MESCTKQFTYLIDQNIDNINNDMRRLHMLGVKQSTKQLKIDDKENKEEVENRMRMVKNSFL